MDIRQEKTGNIHVQKPADEKCKEWIESVEFSSRSDDCSSISECPSSSLADSELSSITDEVSRFSFDSPDEANHLRIISTGGNSAGINHTEVLQNVFKGNNSQTFNNIQVENSQKVHIGNVTYVTGPIHIIHASGNNLGSFQQILTSSNPSTGPTAPKNHQAQQPKATKGTQNDIFERTEERNCDDVFLQNVAKKIDARVLKIIDRRTWLAQPALDYQELQTPVEYVIISHTATESADTQAGMVYMVRNIQCFHIESRRWNDIAYNFLIGNDGNVYEGRGWKRIGAHTHGYNSRGIGISFVGCFMNELPANIAIEACKLLIGRGLELGHISPSYKLVAHCQCSATESPGRKLFEEVKTWPHWTAEP